MPVSFEDLFSRAAEPILQDLAGRQAVRLLARIDPSLMQPGRLREIALGLHPPAQLLLDPSSRKELLSLLRPAEAQSLCVQLGLPPENAYDALASLRLRRGSAAASTLLDFFSVAVSDETRDEAPSSDDVDPARPLFAHQRLPARRVIDQLQTEPNRVLLHMPTGAGKTRTAMEVIAHQMRSAEPFLVVWLAHSEELCEQAVGEFISSWRCLGNRRVAIRRWWGAHDLQSGPADGIVVAGLAKVYASLRRSLGEVGLLAGRVGLIVMDEAHQAIAPTYQAVLDMLATAGQPAPLLGLTATPGRTWNDIAEDERLADFFHRRKIGLQVEGYSNPVAYLVDEGYLARTTFSSLLYSSGIELTDRDREQIAQGLDIPDSVVRRLADDEQRNLMIVQRVEQMARRHHRLIVFAATVEHAVVLAAVLRARGIWAHEVTGTTPRIERARRIDEYRSRADEVRVLVNFGVLTTGFDAPDTSGAIIARPTVSLVLYSQMVGRATRGVRAGGNAEAEIATVVDTELPGFKSMTDAFHNWEDVWQTTP